MILDIEELQMRVRARRIDISVEGRKYKGVSPNCDPKVPPGWYEPQAFKYAQELFGTYGCM